MTTYDDISNGRIRQLNISQDLSQVADLIELCFVGTIDEEGNDYIRYLRKMASDAQSMYWGSVGIQRTYAPLQGFVYTVDEKIVGNLSLLPFHKSDEFIYLIANVAVRPEFRRKGIAKQLTSKALQYVNSKSAKSAWLQVRDDNPGAHQLYLELGFQEQCRRTTWTLPPNKSMEIAQTKEISMKSTSGSDWQDHQQRLNKVYPDMVKWNLGFRVERFNPGLLPRLTRFLNGQFIKNYALFDDNQKFGYITFEKTSLFSDPIWLACEEENDEIILNTFFRNFIKNHRILKPLTINLPVGRSDQTLLNLGFVKNHTLIWMKESTFRSF